jgi:hypothetical protein
MSGFEVVHRGRDRGGYLYLIQSSGRAVAELWHNHRGEEHMIKRSSLGGQWEGFENILDGGGPEPLRVSAWGAEVLSKYLAQKGHV